MGDLAVSWPIPEEPPVDLQARFDRLNRMYAHSQDLYYRSLRERRRMHQQAARLIELLRFIRERRDSLGMDELASLADRMWGQVLAPAEENRAFESRVDAHRPKPTPPEAPPHDVAEFSWDECAVTRLGHDNRPWRITWRGGEVHTLEPYPGHTGNYKMPPYWAPMAYDTRAGAEKALDERRQGPPEAVLAEAAALSSLTAVASLTAGGGTGG